MNSLINFGFAPHDPRRIPGKPSPFGFEPMPFEGFGFGSFKGLQPMQPQMPQMPQQNALMPLMNFGRRVQRY